MTSDLHHLAAAYALDALDDVERRRFEAHYPTCDICASEVIEFREVAADLAGAEATGPPEHLRDQVLGEVSRTAQLPPLVRPGSEPVAAPRTTRRMASAAGLIAAALILVAGTFAIARSTSDGPSSSEVVAATDAIVATLDPAADVDGVIQVVWSAEQNRAVIVGSDLDPVDEGRSYALWSVSPDGAKPVALFRPSDSGSVSSVVDTSGLGPGGWGVTIEPDTGSAQPTTPIIFVTTG